MSSVTRISDYTYRLENPVDGAKAVILHATPQTGIPQFCYRLASAAAAVLFDEHGNTQFDKDFEYSLCRWTFKPVKAELASWPQKLLSMLTSMVHKHSYTKVHQAFLVRKWSFASYFNPYSYFSRVHPLLMSHHDLTLQAIERHGRPDNVDLVRPITRSEWVSGMRATIAYDEDYKLCSSARFEDPFTKLTRVAYQHYEGDFSARDDFLPGDCRTRIRFQEPGRLVLVDKQVTGVGDIASNDATVRAYRAWLASELGAAKLSYLEHLFQIDLKQLGESGDGLTPEHVYRMNIGSQMLELSDLREARAQLAAFSQGKLNFEDLSGLLRRGLYREYGDMLEHKLAAALEQMKIATERELCHKSADWLITLLRPSPKESAHGFSGRHIADSIRAYYTRAGLKDYKPWVEVQELLQAFSSVESSESWEHFLELVAMVLPKRQLVREHPVEGFRVGAIIPAPLHREHRRWYKVASFASNKHGIMCYVLEPLCPDKSMPTLIVPRSTASSSCHLRWAASVLNDLNRLNSPGYEGSLLLRDYVREVFKPHSIPVWCAYAHVAELQMELLEHAPHVSPELFEPIKASLERAQYEYLVAQATKTRPFTLSEVIRRYDYILNPLYYECAGFPAAGRKQIAKAFVAMYENELVPLRLRPSTPSDAQLQDLAQRLTQVLEKLRPELEQHDPDSALIRTLDEHLCSDIQKRRHDECVVLANRELEDRIDRLPILVQEALELGDYNSALHGLRLWANIFADCARALGEHPDQKRPGGLALVGHSLGAAISQQLLHSYLIHEQRMPLPGERLLGKFIYGPKINREDNEDYLAFAKAHWRLFLDLQASVDICHHFEVGDPVPTTGEGEHLGAAHTQEDADLLDRFQRFDGRALERAECPTVSNEISQSVWAHETRFHGLRAQLITDEDEGGEGDFRLYNFSALELGFVDNKGHSSDTAEPRIPCSNFVNGRLDPNASSRVTLEAWRTGRSFNKQRIWLEQERRKTDRSTSHSDANGVFIVTDQGVQTGREGAKQIENEKWVLL